MPPQGRSAPAVPVLDWTRPREKRPGHLPVDMLSFPRFTSIKPCPPGGNPGRDAADSLTGRSLTRAFGERAGVQEGDPTITAPQITAWNLPGYHRTPCAARSAATADEILWPCAVAIEIETQSRNRSWSRSITTPIRSAPSRPGGCVEGPSQTSLETTNHEMRRSALATPG
ncbi:hypothetical protein J7T55_011642 [Diaporthe amygdali]|uniref:uncharacterized protein n=1 Tax=Phomopsis amygdali TaxID=1214568 RepID=UPI0022FF4286|nr:uncharacterized protein J7T55_011642 [Diaporthe amygdali]KAJ0123178.1 hypothetical protein J7T55_011642 [Diaporthe amygdali]